MTRRRAPQRVPIGAIDCPPVDLDSAQPIKSASVLSMATDAHRAAERMTAAINGRTSYSDTIAIAAALARDVHALTAAICDAYACGDGLPNREDDK